MLPGMLMRPGARLEGVRPLSLADVVPFREHGELHRLVEVDAELHQFPAARIRQVVGTPHAVRFDLKPAELNGPLHKRGAERKGVDC